MERDGWNVDRMSGRMERDRAKEEEDGGEEEDCVFARV